MASVCSRAGGVVVLVASGLLVAGTLPAGPGSGKERASADAAGQKLQKLLDQVVTLEIVDQPLELAISQLRDQTRAPLVLDRMVVMMLQQNDPSQQQAVNLKLERVKLRSGLRTMLTPLGLTYVIMGDTVLVTSEDMAVYRQLRQPVSVDLDNAPLGQSLSRLGRDTAANIVVDGRVSQQAATPVSLRLDDVPLETAVRILAEQGGLKPVRMGNVLYVTTKANANELRSDPELSLPNQPGEGREMMMLRMMGQGGLGFMGGAPQAAPPPPAPAAEKPEPAEKPAPDK